MLTQSLERIDCLQDTNAMVSKIIAVAFTDRSFWVLEFDRNISLFGKNEEDGHFESISIHRVKSILDIFRIWMGYTI